ncbi:MAG: hypothetical protein ABSB71_07805 [Candidatus Bathyarchaeia archaeon]|jgi:hypothetical protein
MEDYKACFINGQRTQRFKSTRQILNVAKKRSGYKTVTFTPYQKGKLYCGMMGHWVLKKDGVPNKSGQLLCPDHGKRLRLKACPKTAQYIQHKNERQRKMVKQ